MSKKQSSKKKCNIVGAYTYVSEGSSVQAPDNTPLSFTETGIFKISDDGILTGEADMAVQFLDFMGKGPLWLLVHEKQWDGQIPLDVDNQRVGSIDFFGSMTVIKSSDTSLIPEGYVMFEKKARSMAYTIGGKDNGNINFVSTSPGTNAWGIGHKIDKSDS